MSTSRNDSFSTRRRPSAPPILASRTQSFTCSADLLRAFERRAIELGCSVDWLLEEAMQRLLVEGSEQMRSTAPINDTTPPPSPARAPMRAQLPAPSLPSPPSWRPKLSSEPMAAQDEPLVLYCRDEQIVIDRHPYVIGRSAILADFQIEDSQVSRRHAVIEHTADGWVISDLGSTNGIIVNGEVVRHAVLRAGVVMSIGPMAFGVASPE